jgi:RNA polymerase sigma factor (TIGR02999 family)
VGARDIPATVGIANAGTEEEIDAAPAARRCKDIVTSQKEITRLLHNWSAGDEDALEALTPLVYDELKRLANRALRGERNRQTLQPTALVHEAYLALVNAGVDWRDRTHFFALAARLMRRILVNAAHARRTGKRGGDAINVTLDEDVLVGEENDERVLALHESIEVLAQSDRRKAEVLELHYFGGLTYEEMAAALDVSTSTLDRELRFAKAWLREHLSAQK